MGDTTTIRVRRKLYNQIAKIQQEEGQRTTIQEEINFALAFYIANRHQETILAHSKIEEILENRLGRFENRVAALLGKVGMDTSIVLIGFLQFLSTELNVKYDDLYDQLRGLAAKYYSSQRKRKDEDE